MITIVALGFAMLVAWHLTSRVVGPLRRLTRGANAIREGRFEEQIDVTSHDELAELASAFNQMATDLADFRRTNIGEVVRTKNILESTLAGLPDAVMLLDADRRIVSMNRAALDVCGAVGLETPLTLDDVHIQGLDCAAVDRAIATGMNSAPVDDLTRTIPVEQGSTVRRLLPRVVPVPEANGDQQRGAILLLSDVTDLVRLDEMRSELVAVASHELQTPLTTLRMTLLMLQESAQDMPERQRELVTTSLIGVGQLHEIIHEFLDLARIEAGELRLNLEPVRVSSLLEDVIRRLEPQAAAQDIELRSTIAPGLPTIAADERRIRMVVENLLSNALKYTPGGGVVSVSANSAEMHGRNGSDAVVIRVADTGPGVPVAFRRRIFEKFFRLEHHQPDYQRQPRGAGIGLYMCRQIIDMHGGTIECTESSGGHGACLVVVLPVDAGAVSVAAPFGSLTAETG
jgi:NtrC-family two-component system sensor histidine kinase KinB